jgi:EAL domain-containing protein (putative c-di-GMP-specific phosphodiesterase class I)/PAS domain-containing protein
MAAPAFVNRPWVRLVLILMACALLGVGLVVTIYLTILDLQWLAFLGGVLFAAILALASQVSKSEWRVARRTRQVERLREQLAQESARTRNATEAMRITEARMSLVANELPSLILYVGRDERCHYHNRAVREKTGLPADHIHGRLLREVIGNAAELQVTPHVAEALSGKAVDFTLAWDTQGKADPPYGARLVPYFADDPHPRGYYLLLTRLSTPPAAAEHAPPQASVTAAPVGAPDAVVESTPAVAEAGETLYLRSITDELMGWGDPRAKLERALAEDQFLLFAQKILPVKSGLPDPVCFEILLRLQEEEDNLLPPGGFIPVAESCGMMQDLDRWVVRALIGYSAGRLRTDPAWRVPLYCVNLSEVALGSIEFARFVRSELQSQNFPGRSLCFEIGEQDVLAHHAEVQQLIAALKPAGCRFTVDGFGSAKVSFTHLKGLPFDFIKIDGVITQNILRNASELAKVHAINTVCGKIGLRTIAEFVESSETLEKLREAGVDYVQGFGIARPGPLAQQQ